MRRRRLLRANAGTAPDGKVLDRPYHHLHYDFGLKPAAVEGGLSVGFTGSFNLPVQAAGPQR